MIKLSQDKIRRLGAELQTEAAAAILKRASTFALEIREADLERERAQVQHDKAAQLALLEAIR